MKWKSLLQEAAVKKKKFFFLRQKCSWQGADGKIATDPRNRAVSQE
jgi:hypothetical protein